MGKKAKQRTEPCPATEPSQDKATDAAGNSYLFFHMANAKHGEFCQWFPAIFVISKADISQLVGRNIDESDPEGSILFNCAEQFMMFCKAARFADTDRQIRVLATPSPKEQKRLGRQTVGFTHDEWDLVKSKVVEAGNIAKFTQNEHLGRKLLATGSRIIVEAASNDPVWGIGYSEKCAMDSQQHWGENRLGRALMVTREHLKREELQKKRGDWWIEQEE
ncbi:hypothetical protein FZEAL_9205 [Fusarium zealandicum]|uniref:NADAR domain-containing protein n=1 Tax=Fusarium zealandicum TaxID=1053134 RepID=A0A8H4UCE8_9HYPO|nr:hypothetical protein FZEAL_9205 [Fusarium zealandicum]